MNALFFVSLAICFGYVLAVCFLGFKAVPESISNSYYMWKAKNSFVRKLAMPLFYGWCLGTSIPLMIWWLDFAETVGNPNFQVFVFIACAALVFTGTAYGHKEPGQMQKVHFASAMVCAALTQVWLLITMWQWVFAIIPIFAICYVLSIFFPGAVYERDGRRSDSKSIIFWLEIGAFISTYAGLAVLYFLNF